MVEETRKYTLRELAGLLDAATTDVRLWMKEFKEYLPTVERVEDRIVASDQDVTTLKVVRHLIKTEMLTVAGVKRKLNLQEAGSEDLQQTMARMADEIAQLRQELKQAREQVAAAPAAVEEDHSATRIRIATISKEEADRRKLRKGFWYNAAQAVKKAVKAPSDEIRR